MLVTDEAGARVLVDALELPFTEVSTALNDLQADPDWWALGKLEAYRRQADPFVHIDADVFLWTPLNPALSAAPVFAQNPEPIPSLSTSYYRPDLLEAVIAPELYCCRSSGPGIAAPGPTGAPSVAACSAERGWTSSSSLRGRGSEDRHRRAQSPRFGVRLGDKIRTI